MRIAVFTNNYLPNPYGVSGSIESFRRELEKRGHTVYVFAPKFKGYVDENSNACPPERRVYRFPAIDCTFKNIRYPIVIPYSYRISRILEKLEIDVVHSQHPNLLGWAAKRWAKKKNVPLIFTWHTLYDQYAHFNPLLPEKIAAWWAIRNAVRYANIADQVITPTPSVTKVVRSWGVTNPNVASVATGVDESYFAGLDREAARHEYEIEDDEIVLALVSRITAEKNVLFLAKAVAQILQKNKKVIFALAGGGSETEAVKKIFNDEKLGSRFRYFGIVNGQIKKDIFAMSDIFVYSSKSETQGMTISEAMYAGLPIVAVDATGVKDLVTNHVTGLLVKENEDEFIKAVNRLVDDMELRKKFSVNAQKIAQEKYTASVCTRKLLEVYSEAIKRK